MELSSVNRERESRNVGFGIEKRVEKESCVGSSHFKSHLFLGYTVSIFGGSKFLSLDQFTVV